MPYLIINIVVVINHMHASIVSKQTMIVVESNQELSLLSSVRFVMNGRMNESWVVVLIIIITILFIYVRWVPVRWWNCNVFVFISPFFFYYCFFPLNYDCYYLPDVIVSIFNLSNWIICLFIFENSWIVGRFVIVALN